MKKIIVALFVILLIGQCSSPTSSEKPKTEDSTQTTYEVLYHWEPYSPDSTIFQAVVLGTGYKETIKAEISLWYFETNPEAEFEKYYLEYDGDPADGRSFYSHRFITLTAGLPLSMNDLESVFLEIRVSQQIAYRGVISVP